MLAYLRNENNYWTFAYRYTLIFFQSIDTNLNNFKPIQIYILQLICVVVENRLWFSN